MVSGSVGFTFSVAVASASSLLSGMGSLGAVGVCGLLQPVGDYEAMRRKNNYDFESNERYHFKHRVVHNV